ncbi:MAG: NifB/NifX family molybdenum-iron cluster-binding protein [Gammaproteobacteria bacterium]|jgi:predicted Fe-Mo cluster-binding NifX family protein
MKIAIPANGRVVSDHFGHCVCFKVFDVQNNQIIAETIIENPGNHKPGVLPQLLKNNEIELVIAGGIGTKAINFFNEMGIKVITGATGLIEKTLNSFINGTLQDGGSICSH